MIGKYITTSLSGVCLVLTLISTIAHIVMGHMTSILSWMGSTIFITLFSALFTIGITELRKDIG